MKKYILPVIEFSEYSSIKNLCANNDNDDMASDPFEPLLLNEQEF